MIKKLISVLILSFLVISQAVAQEGNKTEEAASQPEGEMVDVKIKIFPWAFTNTMVIPDFDGKSSRTRKIKNSGDTTSELWYKSGNSYKVLNISSGQMSKYIDYKGPQHMKLYKREQLPQAEGEENTEPVYVYKEACSMMIPLGIDEMFAMMFKSGKTVRFYPMNVSPKRLPKDKIAVINMTSYNAAVLVGGEAKLLRSGSNAIFKPKNKSDRVEVKIARMIDKQWRPVYKNNIVAPTDKRCIVLIFDPYNRKTPKFSVQLLTL